MVIQLYAAPLSTASLRVAQVLHEKKVPFEFHSIDLGKKEQKAEGYLEKQPFGQVPYIVSVFLSQFRPAMGAHGTECSFRMTTASSSTNPGRSRAISP
jgi:hypothetical protein